MSSFILCKIQKYHILIYLQQDATLHSLFISGKCSTCFGWYIHSSSGTTISTASGTCKTITAICRYSGGIRTGSNHPKHVEQFPDINKLCNVASCWLYIRIYLRCTDRWTSNLNPEMSPVYSCLAFDGAIFPSNQLQTCTFNYNGSPATSFFFVQYFFFNKTRMDFNDVAENSVHFVVTIAFPIFYFNVNTSHENSVDGKS